MSEELRDWTAKDIELFKQWHVAHVMCAKMGQVWDGPGLLRPEDYLLMADAAIGALKAVKVIGLKPTGKSQPAAKPGVKK